MVYVLLENCPEITIRRRSTGWETQALTGIDAMLDLPEIGIIMRRSGKPDLRAPLPTLRYHRLPWSW